MSRYLIEVPHEREIMACARAIQILLSSGSHYLTHADFGCGVGEHKSWITVEVDSEQEARAILPPAFRAQAKIIRLENFTLEQIDEMLAQHAAPAAPILAAAPASPADSSADSAGDSSGHSETKATRPSSAPSAVQSSGHSGDPSSAPSAVQSSGHSGDPASDQAVEDRFAQPVG